MKTIGEVEALLNQPYSGPTKQVKGSGGKMYTYIPWNESRRAFDEVFGPANWSSEVTQLEAHPAEGIYVAAVKITGYALADDGSVVAITRSGVGRGVARASKDEYEATGARVSSDLGIHDTAAATAGSDAFSRAAKLFGERFGVNLYDKDSEGDQAGQPSSYQRPQAQSGKQFTGQIKEPGKPASQGQINFGRTLGIDVSGMTMGEASAAIDAAKAGGAAPKAAPARTRTPDDLDDVFAAA